MADTPTTEQVRQAQAESPLRPMPLVVLSHAIPFAAPVPGWSTAKMEAIMLDLQKDLQQPRRSDISRQGGAVQARRLSRQRRRQLAEPGIVPDQTHALVRVGERPRAVE
jgi:hypothetical protein